MASQTHSSNVITATAAGQDLATYAEIIQQLESSTAYSPNTPTDGELSDYVTAVEPEHSHSPPIIIAPQPIPATEPIDVDAWANNADAGWPSPPPSPYRATIHWEDKLTQIVQVPSAVERLVSFTLGRSETQQIFASACLGFAQCTMRLGYSIDGLASLEHYSKNLERELQFMRSNLTQQEAVINRTYHHVAQYAKHDPDIFSLIEYIHEQTYGASLRFTPTPQPEESAPRPQLARRTFGRPATPVVHRQNYYARRDGQEVREETGRQHGGRRGRRNRQQVHTSSSQGQSSGSGANRRNAPPARGPSGHTQRFENIERFLQVVGQEVRNGGRA